MARESQSRRVDIPIVAGAALASGQSLLPKLFPKGVFEGNEFCIGDLKGNAGRSLKINCSTGVWKDFSEGSSGGDLVALYAAINNLTQSRAAHRLAALLGIDASVRKVPRASGEAPSVKSRGQQEPKLDWRPVLPVPAEAPEPKPNHFRLGVPPDQYPYLDAEGRLQCLVCRWPQPPKVAGGKPRKEVAPYCWCTEPGGASGWHFKHPFGQKPLYHLERLAALADAGVLVVEGEGKCDAAQRMFDAAGIPVVVTSWMGGSSSVDKADISPLKGRRVVVWPDNDPSGVNAANQMARRLADQGCKALIVVDLTKLPEKKPPKWDLGDAEREGWTADDVIKVIKASGPWKPPVGEVGGAAPLVSPATPSTDSRPVIQIVAGEMPRMVDEAEAALNAANMGIYQRGTTLVRSAMVAVRVSDGRSVEVPRLVEILKHHLIELLASAALWVKWDARSKAMVTKDPPMAVAETLLARVGEWSFPVLTGQVSAPTLRPDGSILDQPGYDPKTGLLFEPRGAEFPRILVDPTRDDALHALDRLVDLVGTFPFVGPADRSVALSAILTAVIRRSLLTAPLHGFSAPTAGSGKSMLVDIPSIITTGREAPVQSPGKTPEEFEKRFGASLIAGDAVVAIDNCDAPLGGEMLCQALTQPLVRVRQLGQSVNHEIVVNTFITATGNALTLVGDLTRRTVLGRLDAEVERPELREFDRDPIEHTKVHRVVLVVAALTVLRAYHIAGRPNRPPVLGSFRDWSDWVRGALVWLGEADPVDTMEAVRADDPKLNALRALIDQWEEVIGWERVTASQAIERACKQTGSGFGAKPEFLFPEFRGALLAVAGSGGAISGVRLGKYLGRVAGRVVGERKIVADHLQHGVQLWKLVAQLPGGDGGDSTPNSDPTRENVRGKDTSDIHIYSCDDNSYRRDRNCPGNPTNPTCDSKWAADGGPEPRPRGQAWGTKL